MELTALPVYLDTEDWLAEELPVAGAPEQFLVGARSVRGDLDDLVAEWAEDDELRAELAEVTLKGFDCANDLTI
jgi:hypothetical protein